MIEDLYNFLKKSHTDIEVFPNGKKRYTIGSIKHSNRRDILPKKLEYGDLYRAKIHLSHCYVCEETKEKLYVVIKEKLDDMEKLHINTRKFTISLDDPKARDIAYAILVKPKKVLSASIVFYYKDGERVIQDINL